MSVPELSSGSIERLLTAPPGENDLWEAGHVFQLLTVKRMNPSREGASYDRFRLVVSDGTRYCHAMLASQLAHLAEDGQLVKYAIVKVDKITCNNVQSKRLLIVLSISVVAHVEERIGEPTSFDVAGQGAAYLDTPAAATSIENNQQPQQQQKPSQTQKAQQRTNGPVIFPIEGLSPYQNKWTIRARVTVKSDIRRYSSAKGEGQLFNVTFMDESGEIRATGFNQQVDQFYDKLEEGKVYYVSKARVNLAKKKFSNIPNEYEMSFARETEITECEDQNDAPQVKYNFVQLAELGNIQKDATCDVIGIVENVSEISEIIAKSTGRGTKKRELTIVDRSGFSVRMTLWGKQAESYNADEHAVLAFKGARVGDFGGRSLSMSNSTHMTVNPDITEAHILRGWFDSLNAGTAFKSQTSAGVLGGEFGTFKREEIRTLAQVKESQIGMGDVAEFFACRATVVHIKGDSLYYPACAKCNKKVFEGTEGWRCEKCELSFEKPEYRYMMSMSVADYTGQIWLQGFQDVGVVITGKTANELHEIKERDEGEYTAVIARANCNTFNFNCRAKQDTYNETTRVRYGIQKIFPMDYRVEAGILRDILKSDWAK